MSDKKHKNNSNEGWKLKLKTFAVSSHPLVYDEPKRESERWKISERWSFLSRDIASPWRFVGPKPNDLPQCGWKIHLSAIPSQAEEILGTAIPILVDAGLYFKVAADPSVYFKKLLKTASVDEFGKLLTAYPVTLEKFDALVSELYHALQGFLAPEILSDAQIGNSPVHFRYGSFLLMEKWCEEKQRWLEALESPSGEVFWPSRSGCLEIPRWAPRSGSINAALAKRDRNAVRVPFEVDQVLRYSSRGLSMKAYYQGREVFVKEVRVLSGFTTRSSDGVSSLKQESKVLEELKGLDGVPSKCEMINGEKSSFLITDYFNGKSLRAYVTETCPLVLGTEEKTDSYVFWAKSCMEKARAVLTRVHDIGWCHGDISPDNILVSLNGEVMIVDWEAAAPTGTGVPKYWTPGFSMADPRIRCSNQEKDFRLEENDLYGLGKIALSLFYPSASQVDFSLEERSVILDEIQDFYGKAAREWLEEFIELPVPRYAFGRVNEFDLAGGIVESWGRFEEHLQVSETIPVGAGSLGSGTIFSPEGLRDLVYTQSQNQYEDYRFKSELLRKAEIDSDLYNRNAVHLTELRMVLKPTPDSINEYVQSLEREYSSKIEHEFTLEKMIRDLVILSRVRGSGSLLRNETSLLLEELGLNLSDLLLSSFGDRKIEASGGLLSGWSGAAMALLQWWEFEQSSRAESVLDVAETMCTEDLLGCKKSKNGSLMIDDGDRLLPYLAEGSAGVLWAITEFAKKHRIIATDEQLLGLIEACSSKYFATAGLFYGRAGCYWALKRANEVFGSQVGGQMVRSQEILLKKQCMEMDGAVYCLGDRNERFTLDFAFGTAGVLYALTKKACRPGDWIPFPELGGKNA